MFVGHYAAALAAKAAEPRAPLWALVAGAQLIDIGWSVLVMTGVEKVSFDAALPGSPLVLEHMPWTHSLPAAVLWGVAAALLCRFALRLSWRPAIMVGLVVLSHWFLDLLVHRPDLEIWFGGLKVGLGFWNLPEPEMALEMGLIAITGGAWLWTRGRQDRAAWPALLFLTFLTVLQIVSGLTPPSGDAFGFGITALVAYLVAAGLAGLIDLRSQRAARG